MTNFNILNNPRLSEQEADELSTLTKALGHPHRLAIIQFLKNSETCMCGDIVEQLPIAQSTVSQHLKKLKASGWIQGTIDGPRVCYCLEAGIMEKFRALVAKL